MPLKIFLLSILFLSSSAFASDGVFEINQDCASVGCFTGDSPGFPVTITRSGSYRLTGNLNNPGVVSDTIRILSSDTESVSIDLNGFTLQGPTTCIVTGASFPICDEDGAGDGISSANSSDGGSILMIRNGTINGMSGYGVIASPTSLVLENLVISENGKGGVSANGRKVTMTNLNVFLNEGLGISSSALGFLNDSVISNNDGMGVDVTYCSNIVSTGNSGSDDCIAILPNRCDTFNDCN